MFDSLLSLKLGSVCKIIYSLSANIVCSVFCSCHNVCLRRFRFLGLDIFIYIYFNIIITYYLFITPR